MATKQLKYICTLTCFINDQADSKVCLGVWESGRIGCLSIVGFYHLRARLEFERQVSICARISLWQTQIWNKKMGINLGVLSPFLSSPQPTSSASSPQPQTTVTLAISYQSLGSALVPQPRMKSKYSGSSQAGLPNTTSANIETVPKSQCMGPYTGMGPPHLFIIWKLLSPQEFHIEKISHGARGVCVCEVNQLSSIIGFHYFFFTSFAPLWPGTASSHDIGRPCHSCSGGAGRVNSGPCSTDTWPAFSAHVPALTQGLHWSGSLHQHLLRAGYLHPLTSMGGLLCSGQEAPRSLLQMTEVLSYSVWFRKSAALRGDIHGKASDSANTKVIMNGSAHKCGTYFIFM